MTTSTAHNIWRREFANARLLNGAFPRQVDPVEFAAWKMRVLRMTFGAVFPRVLRPAFGPGLASATAASWWLAGGATGAVAVYQPIGAASLALPALQPYAVAVALAEAYLELVRVVPLAKRR